MCFLSVQRGGMSFSEDFVPPSNSHSLLPLLRSAWRDLNLRPLYPSLLVIFTSVKLEKGPLK